MAREAKKRRAIAGGAAAGVGTASRGGAGGLGDGRFTRFRVSAYENEAFEGWRACGKRRISANLFAGLSRATLPGSGVSLKC